MNKPHNDAERILSIVAASEGDVISPALAKMCRDLLGYSPTDASAPAFELIKNQILILLVGRLGGSVRIPLADVDGKTSGKLLMMQFDEPTQEFTFFLENKIGRG